MQNPTTVSQKVGIILFSIGAMYMIIMGWLLSWWVVPAIREGGVVNLPGQLFFFLWSLSTPLGALLVTIGAAMMSRVDRRRIWFILGGFAVVIAWFIMGSTSRVIPTLFGVGGGLIMLFFLGMVLDWVRDRQALSDTEKLGADLRIVGMVFFLIAAWFLCGLLGAPVYLLRPELHVESGGGSSLASTILICLTLGWGFTYFGNRISMRKKG